MEKKVLIKVRPEDNVNLYGISFNTDKLFGFNINEADKIKEEVVKIAQDKKETMVFDYYGDVTREYINVEDPSKLYYNLINEFGIPVMKLTDKHREYFDSLFGIFCNNINCYKTGIVVLFLDGYWSKKKKFKKTEKYLISIQSSSDVITNSSSELFCVSSSENSNDLYKLLRNYSNKNDRGNCSGMGGDIDIYEINFSKLVNCLYGENNPNMNKAKIEEKIIEIYKECYDLPKEGTLYEIDIDHGFINTMNFIQDELKGILV